jgi:FlaG/FlaF family flagellin (archaellin)
MKHRGAISPFIATVVLVAITLTLGGVLYNQFSQVISAEVRNPSMSLAGIDVGGDRQTIVVGLKNDGNVPYTVSKVLVDYQSTEQRFVVGGTGNGSVIAGTPQISPGGQVTLRFTLAGLTIPNFSTFTVTVISDQIARAFTIQA